MILHSTNGITLELSIEDYQFPHITTDYAANWLLIRIDVQTPNASWHGIEPSALTWDMLRLIKWLEAIGQSRPTAAYFDIPLDYDFCFDLTKSTPSSVALKVMLRHNYSNLENKLEKLYLDLEVSRQNCLEAAKMLWEQMALFPLRE